MSKERELINDMKILLECTDMGSLQRRADVLIGRAIEILTQPEPSLTGDQLIDMWRDGYDSGARLAQPEQNIAGAVMPNGVCVSNVYDAYEAGRASVLLAQPEQEPSDTEIITAYHMLVRRKLGLQEKNEVLLADKDE